jgi:hypothetical protein
MHAAAIDQNKQTKSQARARAEHCCSSRPYRPVLITPKYEPPVSLMVQNTQKQDQIP